MDIKTKKDKLKLKLSNKNRTDSTSNLAQKTMLFLFLLILPSVLTEMIKMLDGVFNLSSMLSEEIKIALISLSGLATLSLHFFACFKYFFFIKNYAEDPTQNYKKEVRKKIEKKELPEALSLFNDFPKNKDYYNSLKSLLDGVKDSELIIALKEGDESTKKGLEKFRGIEKAEALKKIEKINEKRKLLKQEMNKIEKENKLNSSSYIIKND